MKTMLLGLAALCVLVGVANGQTNQVQLMQPPPETQAPGQPRMVATAPPAPTRLQRIFGPTATTGGVVPAIRRGQLLRRAPAQPGQVYENVSVNPSTGRAEGIVLFSIKF